MSTVQLNTGNLEKFQEFKRLFAYYGKKLDSSHKNLDEIDSDPYTVIAHKATQVGEGILVEDTSLDIEEAACGIHVKWFLHHLPEYIGHKALWTVLLACRSGGTIMIYRGQVEGIIVESKGHGGFGFDPYFLPRGASQTLAQAKPDRYNARAKAVHEYVQGNVFTTLPSIEKWTGPWQRHEEKN